MGKRLVVYMGKGQVVYMGKGQVVYHGKQTSSVSSDVRVAPCRGGGGHACVVVVFV